MPSQITRHPFSMVEIMLALGVVAIGVISIMGLFPIGIVASRDTAMETYAANAAEELLSYFKNYTEFNAQNREKSNDRWDYCFSLERGVFKDISSNSNNDDEGPNTNALTSRDLESDKKKILDETFSKTIYMYDYNQDIDPPQFTDTFLFLNRKLSSQSPNPPSQRKIDRITDFDFTAVARLRYSKDSSPTSPPPPEPLLYTLYAEISWPATRPYEFRTKKTYTLNLINPYNNDYIRLLEPRP